MYPRLMLSLLAALILLGGSTLMSGHLFQDGEARTIFLESRKKTNAHAPAGNTKKGPVKTPPATGTQAAVEALGLGVTVFLKDGDGKFNRTSPTRVFKSGQAVRIHIEGNSDGYLYIFHQENDGPQELFFPDSRVDGGNNQIKAHVPLEVPDNGEFTFDEKPSIETLTIVISRVPLPGINAGKGLEAQQNQPIPSTVVNQIAKNTESIESLQSDEGTKMTTEEGTRGMGLKITDPSPTKTIVNRDKAEGKIVTKLKLIHQ